ncbi:hypothetical protein [Clostridium sp.]|uniref:hypothetical protein n=1 Tax=Clostridium sp. TaxID=1506 RepID=UPI002FC87B74
MKNYLICVVVFSILGLYVASIYGAVAFAVVYSFAAIVYKLDKIEERLNEITKSEK